jgi:hypothetical protein
MCTHPRVRILCLAIAASFASLCTALAQTKPVVVSTVPANGATNVSRSLPSVSVSFSKPMKTYAPTQCVIMTSGWRSGGPITWSADNKTVTYTSADNPVNIPAGMKVTIWVPAPSFPLSCQDTEGNVLDPYTLSFTAAGAVVASTSPRSGATVNSSLSSISVTFSGPMDTTGCGATTDKWLGGVANCSWSADKKTMTFSRPNPSTPHTPGVTVTVTLNPSGQTPVIKDADGNPLDTYTFTFFVERSPTQLTKVAADPTKGFSWPYYLYVPGYLKSPPVLFVEPNNTGYVSDDPRAHDQAAYALINFEMNWADYMGTPYLIPTFPRPASDVTMYTQALDRKTLLTTIPGLVRIDLQLIAMIQDAQALLATKGIVVDKKVFMLGGSASGMFVSRFTALHPETLKAASIGAPGRGPIVPVAQWNGVTLPYPNGISDLEGVVGKKFDLDTFRTVPMQIWVGDEDLSIEKYVDFTDPEEARMMSAFVELQGYQRWPRFEAAFNSADSYPQFVIFPGMPHSAPSSVFLGEFFERNRSTAQPPLPKPYLYKFCFPHITTSAPWETEIALVSTLPDGVPVRGQLLAYHSIGGDAIATADITIAPGGRKEINVGSFFPNTPGIAYLMFQCDSGFVAGYTRFQQPGNWASLTMSTGSTQGWFTKVETDGWTGIAFVNVEDNYASNIATVNLTALDGSGKQIASTTLSVMPGQKYLGMVNQLFRTDVSAAKYIRYDSNQRLLGFSVSSSTDNQMLDGLNASGGYVPPQ